MIAISFNYFLREYIMKKLFLYTLASTLLYSASTWAMALEEKIGQLPSKIAHKQTQTNEDMYPIDPYILGRTDLPFSLALEAFDTGKPILLSSGQALKLDRSSVSKGRQHIPSDVSFYASGVRWYEYSGKTWFHISFTSDHNPHWSRQFVSSILDEQGYWNRESVLEGTGYIQRHIDFEFELMPLLSTENSCLSLRSSVITPWLCIPSEDVIPLREHANLLQTGVLFPIPEGYVRLIRTGTSLPPIKTWGNFITTPDHGILQAINSHLDQGWHFSALPKPSGYFADIFRTSGAEDPDREIKESMLALARKGNWVVLRVSYFLNSSSQKPKKPRYINYSLLLEFFPSMEYTAQANEYRLTGKKSIQDDKKVASAGLSTELEALFSGRLQEQSQRVGTVAAAAADDAYALSEEENSDTAA